MIPVLGREWVHDSHQWSGMDCSFLDWMWIVSPATAPLVLGLRSLHAAFRLMSEKVLMVMCRVWNMRACGCLFNPKLTRSGNPLWIGWRVAGGTGRPSSCASLSDRASGNKTPKLPYFHSMSEAKRSECVGLSARVKHGHVVPSKYCTWLRFDNVRPSIRTQTLVA